MGILPVRGSAATAEAAETTHSLGIGDSFDLPGSGSEGEGGSTITITSIDKKGTIEWVEQSVTSRTNGTFCRGTPADLAKKIYDAYRDMLRHLPSDAQISAKLRPHLPPNCRLAKQAM